MKVAFENIISLELKTFNNSEITKKIHEEVDIIKNIKANDFSFTHGETMSDFFKRITQYQSMPSSIKDNISFRVDFDGSITFLFSLNQDFPYVSSYFLVKDLDSAKQKQDSSKMQQLKDELEELKTCHDKAYVAKKSLTINSQIKKIEEKFGISQIESFIAENNLHDICSLFENEFSHKKSRKPI